MSKFEYPRVHAPHSQQPQPQTQLQLQVPNENGAAPDFRPYSWVNSAREPEDGRFQRNAARQSKIPPLPQIPDHLNPALQSNQVLSAVPSSDGTPVPEYTRVADQNSEPYPHNVSSVPQQSYPSTNAADPDTRRPFHRSTPSNAAPEVIKYEYPPQQPKPVVIAPDASALTPTYTTFPQSRTNTTNLPVISPSNAQANFIPNVSEHVQSTSSGGLWKHALCSCADTSTCLTGLFCPCVLYGKTQHRLTLRSEKRDPTNMLGYSAVNGSCAVFAVLCGCNWILAAIQHTRVRKTYEMNREAGGVGGDCAMALCCCCCTLAQDEKEVKYREVESRRGDISGESMKIRSQGQYQAPVGMAYPAPPR